MSEPLDTPLPCDVQINHIRYRKGVALRTLVGAATRWHTMLSRQAASPAEQSALPRDAIDPALAGRPSREEIARVLCNRDSYDAKIDSILSLFPGGRQEVEGSSISESGRSPPAAVKSDSDCQSE